MKIERTTATRAARAVGTAAYARRVEAASAADPVDPVVATSILGIPEAEFTPRVRDAIMGLMGEVDELRRIGRKRRRKQRDRCQGHCPPGEIGDRHLWSPLTETTLGAGNCPGPKTEMQVLSVF